MSRKVINEYSTLGSTCTTSGTFVAQAGIVTIESTPKNRVYLGCEGGETEELIYERIAMFGNELPFDFVEKLYKMMKEQRDGRD